MYLVTLCRITPWSILTSAADIWYLNMWWRSRIISVEGDVSSLPDLHIGKVVFNPITITLDNSDSFFNSYFNSTEARGGELLVRYYNKDDNSVIGLPRYYAITDVTITREHCIITGNPYTPGAFDSIIPKASIQKSIFGDYVDESSIGKPISTWFGLSNNVPLYSIYEGGTGDDYHHDFLIGYGTIAATTSEVTITRDGVEADAGSFTLYDGSQASPYAGYAFVRFDSEQRDGNGNLYDTRIHNLRGVLIGGAYTFNPVSCFKEFLTNTTWGLGITVDSATFTSAIAQCNVDLTITNGLYDFKKASEWIDCFLAACNYSIFAAGENKIYYPSLISTVSATFDNHNATDFQLRKRSANDYCSTINLHYAHNLKDNTDSVESASTGKSFGIVQDYYSPFTKEQAGANVIATLLKNRYIYQDNVIEFTTGEDGYVLAVGNIISVTLADLGLSDNQFEIIEIEKSSESVRIKAASYSHDVFQGT